MRQSDPRNRKPAESETAALDPIALTLALWLGVVVGVTGLMRLSENAAENAARTQRDGPHAMPASFQPGMMISAPYGS